AAPSTIHNNASQHFFGTQSASHTESFQQQTAHLQQSMQQSHFSPVAAGARVTGPGNAESRGTSVGTSPAAGKPSASATANENGNRGSSTSPAASANRSESASPSRGEPNRSEWKTF